MSSSSARRIATEVVVIVGSILLAFALDAWWDERQEDARVDAMLAAVADEFMGEAVVMDSIIATNERAMEWIEAAVVRTDPSLPPVPEDSIAVIAGRMNGFQFYDPGFGALAALVSSGLLERVDDAELRRALGGWSGEIEDVLLSRDLVYDRTSIVADLVARRGRGADVLLGRRPWVARFRGMVEDPALRSAEALAANDLVWHLDDLVRARARARAIAAMIRAHVSAAG